MSTTFKNSIHISKSKVQKAGGLVVLSLKEYQKLQEQAIPTYYLTGKEALKLDKEVEQALKDHRDGKTTKANSIGEALKIYDRKINH